MIQFITYSPVDEQLGHFQSWLLLFLLEHRCQLVLSGAALARHAYGPAEGEQ